MSLTKEEYDEETKQSKIFIDCCGHGDLKSVKSLMADKNNFEKNIKSSYGYSLAMACYGGHLEVVKYLTSPENFVHCTDSQLAMNASLNQAVEGNNLDIVKYLVTSENVNPKPNPFYTDEALLEKAINYRCFDVIDYFLSSPEFKDKADISIFLKTACMHSKLDEVKDFFSFPDFQPYIKKTEHSEFCFITSYNKHTKFGVPISGEDEEWFRYFIFDLNVPKTEAIESCFAKNRNERIENMFKLRELNQELNETLAIKETSKRPKL